MLQSSEFMPERNQEVFERGAAADLWRHTLSALPTQFSRLAYLASLRDPNTGRYLHYGLSSLYGDDEADRVLRESHWWAFSEWLSYMLEQQKADLDLYLSSLEGPRRETLEAWAQLRPYTHYMPSTSRAVERRLFLSDLETLLELLRNEHGVVSPDPNA